MRLSYGYLNSQSMTASLWIFGILGGILWSVGQNGQLQAMKYMGVSVANPLSSGAQLVGGSLVGALVFHEWTKPIQFILGLTALTLLVIGFYFSSKRDGLRTSFGNTSRVFKRICYELLIQL